MRQARGAVYCFGARTLKVKHAIFQLCLSTQVQCFISLRGLSTYRRARLPVGLLSSEGCKKRRAGTYSLISMTVSSILKTNKYKYTSFVFVPNKARSYRTGNLYLCAKRSALTIWNRSTHQTRSAGHERRDLRWWRTTHARSETRVWIY